jgi:hypothetical protein
MARPNARVIAHRDNMRAEQRLRASWRDAYLEQILAGASRLRPKGVAEDAIRAAYQAGYNAAAEALGQDTVDQRKARRAAQRRWGRAHADSTCRRCYGYGFEGGEPCPCAGELPADLRDPAKPTVRDKVDEAIRRVNERKRCPGCGVEPCICDLVDEGRSP